ncbi:MAG: hypothetical protein AAF721_17045 [Myxococcota bacterium]
MAQLETIAEGVYGANTEFKLGGGIKLPLRMTVLHLDEGLALIAPIPIDDALAAELEALAPVRFILAPNLLHYAYVNAAAERYPDARVLGVTGLSEKKPNVKFDGVLEAGSLTDEVDTFALRGADKLNEMVFLHHPSSTLVVTDLVFNIHGATGMSKLVLGMMSRALGRVEQSRLCRWLTHDRDAAGQSVAEILALPFDRVVMAHGNVIERQAKAELTAGLWWMRGHKRREEPVHAS